MSRETIVILKVLDDREGRPWWAALGLPDPARWGVEGTFGDDEVYPSVVLDDEVAR